MAKPATVIRTAIRVEGIVQGVGFRPFVYSLATGLGLAGFVGNDVDGVFIEVEGAAEALREFLLRLEREAPPLARIERVRSRPVPPRNARAFAIAASGADGQRTTLVAADSATCADCLRELFDPDDRRFGYAFINCTNCGPRFTIVRDVPYDRALTTMAEFRLCERCAAEYHDPADRRFHAQPTCCPDCGPRVTLTAAPGGAARPSGNAHVASCLADNGAEGPVIGVAFDGTGYGADGTIWGGEFLVADLAGFQRGGHLAPVRMPGGQAAIRQPWRMAAAYLEEAYPGEAYQEPAGPGGAHDVFARNRDRWAAVVSMARQGVNSPVTSSAGRLFDAVASILGVRDEINYEGQAAVELEQLAGPDGAGGHGGYRAGIEPGPPFRARGADLVRAVVDDLAAGVPRDVVAARFHHGVAALIEEGCLLLRERHGLGTVALSGGVFQNLLLLGATVARLEARGFTVLLHSRVPCNDGGISLGQAVIAGARDRARDRPTPSEASSDD